MGTNTYTFKNAVDAVYSRLKETDSALLPNTDVKRYINDAHMQVVNEKYYPFMEERIGFEASPTITNSNTFNVDGNNLVSCDSVTDQIYVHDGISDEIYYSFNDPAGSTVGLAYDGENLISSDSSNSRVYVHDGVSDTITSSFTSTVSSVFRIAYDGSNLISCDNSADKIYVHDGISDIITTSFSSPGGSPGGLTYDGTNLISCDYTNKEIYIHDGISDTITTSFASPANLPFGLTYDGNNLISVSSSLDTIYVHSGVSGVVIDSFSTPGNQPNGITFVGSKSIETASTKYYPSSGTILINEDIISYNRKTSESFDDIEGVEFTHNPGENIYRVYDMISDLGIDNFGRPIYLEVDKQVVDYYDGRGQFRNDKYSIIENQFLILPKISSNHPVTFKYQKELIDLTEDGDLFIIPDQYATMIVEFAIYKAKIDLGYADYELNFREYMRIKQRMRSFYARQQFKVGERVKSVYQDGYDEPKLKYPSTILYS